MHHFLGQSNENDNEEEKEIAGLKLGLLVVLMPTISMLLASILLTNITVSKHVEGMFQNFAAGLILAAVASELFPLMLENERSTATWIGVTLGFVIGLLTLYGMEMFIDYIVERSETKAPATSDDETNLTLTSGTTLSHNSSGYKTVSMTENNPINNSAIDDSTTKNTKSSSDKISPCGELKSSSSKQLMGQIINKFIEKKGLNQLSADAMDDLDDIASTVSEAHNNNNLSHSMSISGHGGEGSSKHNNSNNRFLNDDDFEDDSIMKSAAAIAHQANYHKLLNNQIQEINELVNIMEIKCNQLYNFQKTTFNSPRSVFNSPLHTQPIITAGGAGSIVPFSPQKRLTSYNNKSNIIRTNCVSDDIEHQLNKDNHHNNDNNDNNFVELTSRSYSSSNARSEVANDQLSATSAAGMASQSKLQLSIQSPTKTKSSSSSSSSSFSLPLSSLAQINQCNITQNSNNASFNEDEQEMQLTEEIDLAAHTLHYKLDQCRRLLQVSKQTTSSLKEIHPSSSPQRLMTLSLPSAITSKQLSDESKQAIKRRLQLLKLSGEHLAEIMPENYEQDTNNTNNTIMSVGNLKEIFHHVSVMDHMAYSFHESFENAANHWNRRKREIPEPEVGSHIPPSLFVPVTLDCFTDGFLIGVSCALSPSAGIVLGIANCLEMGFLGMAYSLRLKKCTGSSWTVRQCALVFPPLVMFLAAGLGAYVAYEAKDTPEVFIGFVAFGTVALLSLVCGELLIEAKEAQGDEDVWYVSIALFAAVYLVLMIHPILS